MLNVPAGQAHRPAKLAAAGRGSTNAAPPGFEHRQDMAA